MSQELSRLDQAAIVELLARNTERFTHLLAKNQVGDEYEKCKTIIQAIIIEMDNRRNTMDNTDKIH